MNLPGASTQVSTGHLTRFASGVSGRFALRINAWIYSTVYVLYEIYDLELSVADDTDPDDYDIFLDEDIDYLYDDYLDDYIDEEYFDEYGEYFDEVYYD